MPGGSHCAIPGCHTQGSKCRGLSFHTLPKKEKDAAWKAKLIDAINRADKSFNPDKAKICSRHFKEDCFRTSQRKQCRTRRASLCSAACPYRDFALPESRVATMASFVRNPACLFLIFALLAPAVSEDVIATIKRPASFWNAEQQALVFPVLSYATLDCMVENLPRGARVMWMKLKEGAMIPLMDVTLPTPTTHRLVLTAQRPLLPEDDGWTYSCRVQTSAQNYVSDQVLLRVVEAPVIAQLVSSNDMEVHEGDSVRLMCDARAYPPANITWSRVDGQPINGAAEVMSKEVLLSAVRFTDAGQYRCRAENVAGQADRIITLTVMYSPRVMAVTSQVSASVGSDVTLTCHVKSFPPASIAKWSSDFHGEIQESDRFVLQRTDVSGDEQTMTLTLKSVALTDAGKYTCSAENLFGYGVANIMVQVTQQ